METQNLNALIYLESLAAPMADITMTITATEVQIKQEIDEITSTIDDLEVYIYLHSHSLSHTQFTYKLLI